MFDFNVIMRYTINVQRGKGAAQRCVLCGQFYIELVQYKIDQYDRRVADKVIIASQSRLA